MGSNLQGQAASPRGEHTIFSAGSMFMTRSRKALSRNGTRASTPHANGTLLARMTSH